MMKFQRLEENQIIKKESVLQRYDKFGNPNGQSSNDDLGYTYVPVVKTDIFTDGELKQITPIQSTEIDKCYINGEVYKKGYTTYTVSEFNVINATYVIKLISSKEIFKLPGGYGIEYVPRTIETYVKNSIDKKNLNDVKFILKQIKHKLTIKDYITQNLKKGITIIEHPKTKTLK